MKNYLLFILTVSLFASCNLSKKPENAAFVQEEPSGNDLYLAVMWQKYSAEYRALCYQSYQQAGQLIQLNSIQDKTLLTPAVIVDVDETILDNSPYELNLIRTNIRYTAESWKAWVDSAAAGAVPGALEFCLKAQELGIHILYVSNRKINETEATLKNLIALGFPYATADHLYFKEESSSKESRRAVIRNSYQVLLLIGDNLGDFSDVFQDRSQHFGFHQVDSLRQQFGTHFIILPNPMYGNWEDGLPKNI
ncbi:MAG: 5'-nucleotidase, lipoprotein e(P4) family [Bacteroidales bacterium]|nr:5'-nucleotidase, lipoprotein e(P4) family [Bacteroidales bacterium]